VVFALGVTFLAGLLALPFLPDFAFFAGALVGGLTRALAGASVGAFVDAAETGLGTGADAAAGVFTAPLGSAPRGSTPLDAVVPASPDNPFAASLSVLTAFSRALVAAVIAASALVRALADVPARVAAMVSLAVADVTRVAAAETARGVTEADPPPAPRLAVVLLAVVLLEVARALVVLAALVVFVLPVLLVARALAEGLAAATVAGFFPLPVVPVVPVVPLTPVVPVVPGSVAAVFVGTDLHPHLSQLRGWHSTESDALHLITRKNSGSARTKCYLKLLFGRRQEPGNDPECLLGRGPSPDRDTHQVARQRHRVPDHVVRDVPGQVEHPRLHARGEHVLDRHIERRADLAKPRRNVSHVGMTGFEPAAP
jgi:hypothetical protein